LRPTLISIIAESYDYIHFKSQGGFVKKFIEVGAAPVPTQKYRATTGGCPYRKIHSAITSLLT
jgi:hypothetical protein